MTRDLDKDFWQYHTENPEVFQLFLRFARQAKRAGMKRYGAKSIVERIRWHIAIETNDPEYKLNNNYTSRYARLLEREYPEFEGFFIKRRIRTADPWCDERQRPLFGEAV